MPVVWVLGDKVQLPEEVRAALRLLPRDPLLYTCTRDALVLTPLRPRGRREAARRGTPGRVLPLASRTGGRPGFDGPSGVGQVSGRAGAGGGPAAGRNPPGATLRPRRRGRRTGA